MEQKCFHVFISRERGKSKSEVVGRLEIITEFQILQNFVDGRRQNSLATFIHYSNLLWIFKSSRLAHCSLSHTLQQHMFIKFMFVLSTFKAEKMNVEQHTATDDGIQNTWKQAAIRLRETSKECKPFYNNEFYAS